MQNHPDSAYLLIAKIRKEAGTSMPYTIAECNISEGLAKMTEGKWTEAEQLFRKTIPVFRTLGDSLAVAKAMDFLGFSLLNQGFLDKHLELQMQVLNYRLKYNDTPNMIARSYSVMGSIYFRMNDLELAMKQYQKTLEIRKKNSWIRSAVLWLYFTQYRKGVD